MSCVRVCLCKRTKRCTFTVHHTHTHTHTHHVPGRLCRRLSSVHSLPYLGINCTWTLSKTSEKLLNKKLANLCHPENPLVEVAPTTLATCSSYNLELWPITLTFEVDLVNIKMNKCAKYLCQNLTSSNVIVRTHRHTHSTREPDRLRYLVHCKNQFQWADASELNHLNFK